MLSPTRFSFLAHEAEIATPDDWNRPDLPRLWTYNLHYFDDLQAVGAEDRRAWQMAAMARWITDNPPTRGAGWEPYPVSRRMVNWIGAILSGAEAAPGALQSLAVQARTLMQRLEFHLMGNHLFANAKALVFAGAFFAGEEADIWLRRGLHLLGREIEEQILPDGGHFELTTMYHAITLEDMIDLVQLAELFPTALREPCERQCWRSRSEAMLGWLARMRHPDGDIGLFNDGAFDQARRPFELFAYARRFRLAIREPTPGIERLADSGYVRLERGIWLGLFDIAEVGASYIPGHAHADTLSFELSFAGARLVTNGGTSIYEPGPLRERERATSAHATIEIDGQDSSEVWASFRVGRRARPRRIEVHATGDSLVASAAHDGYRFLPGRPEHHRQITMNDTRVEIRDTVSGGGRHLVIARFPLHPDIVEVEKKAMGWSVHTSHGIVEISVDGPGKPELEDGFFAPAFGVRQDRRVLAWRYEGDLPLSLTTSFEGKSSS